MSRRNKAQKRKIQPDPAYHNLVVAKFLNCLMEEGKKGTAEKILYSAMEMMKKKLNKNPLELFLEIIDKVKPSIEVRSRRVGGATYQVPTEVRYERREALALRWIIEYARKRNEKSMDKKLFGEFMDVLSGNGASLKKRADTHKMAEANKAFAHFKW